MIGSVVTVKEEGGEYENVVEVALCHLYDHFARALGLKDYRESVNRVMEHARKFQLSLLGYMEKNGFDVVYFDTDRVFVNVDGLEEGFDVADAVDAFARAYFWNHYKSVRYPFARVTRFFTYIKVVGKKRYYGRWVAVDGSEHVTRVGV